MRRIFPTLTAGLIASLMFISMAWAAFVMPAAPSGYVLDEADVLSPEAKAKLESDLATLEQETTTEIAVVALSSLQGYSIEQVALEIGREWGVGQADFNNGVVMLVAPSEREARIEVGYGLEGVITDAQAFMIIDQVMIPEFRNENYEAGILNGIAHLENLARGESFTLTESTPGFIETIAGAIEFFVVFFVLLGWGIFSWMSQSKAWWAGGVFGAVVGFLATGSLIALGIGGFIGLLLDFILSTFLYTKIKPPRGGRGGRGGFFG